jgi:hypothetical protein
MKRNSWQVATASLSVLSVVLAVMLLTASDTPEGESSVEPTATTGRPTPGPETATTSSSPREVAGGSWPAGPLVAVKVDNAPAARPHIGLTSATFLLEAPVEGGLTRLTAIYEESSLGLVGPVRSLRPVDADLLAPFRPVDVYATGGRPFVVGSVIGSGMTVHTPENSAAFHSLERPAPHHLFAVPQPPRSDESRPAGLPWRTGDPPTLEEPAGALGYTVGTERIVWRYQDGTYLRWNDDDPFMVLSAPDGEASQLEVDVVVLMFVNRKSAGYTDSAGAEVPTFDVVGGGDLVAAWDGRMVRGRWFRDNQADLRDSLG